MKKGMNEFGIEPGLSREEEFRRLSEAGFDGVEICLNDPMSAEEIAEVKGLIKKYSLNVHSLVANRLWEFPLSANCPDCREKGKELVKMLITTACEFGADSVLVVPGVVTDKVSYIDAYNNSFNSLSELRPFINEHKINICVENVWNKMLLTPFEMRDFIDKLNSPYICSYFDAGNILINSYPEYWIEVLEDRIKKVHIKDFKRSAGNMEGFVDLLEGDMDWGKLMGALRKVGYDDYVTVEVPYYKTSPEFFAKKTSMALDVIFAQ